MQTPPVRTKKTSPQPTTSPVRGTHPNLGRTVDSDFEHSFRAIPPLFAQLHTIRTSTLQPQTFPSEKASKKGATSLVVSWNPGANRRTLVANEGTRGATASWPGPPALWLCQKDATSLQESTCCSAFILLGISKRREGPLSSSTRTPSRRLHTRRTSSFHTLEASTRT